MVNLTISLSEETVRRLRRAVKERYGSRRGAISGIIEEALLALLERFEAPRPSQSFRALKDDSAIAEGESLEELASKLKKQGVDPRGVRILSSAPIAPVARAGFRARKA